MFAFELGSSKYALNQFCAPADAHFAPWYHSRPETTQWVHSGFAWIGFPPGVAICTTRGIQVLPELSSDVESLRIFGDAGSGLSCTIPVVNSWFGTETANQPQEFSQNASQIRDWLQAKHKHCVELLIRKGACYGFVRAASPAAAANRRIAGRLNSRQRLRTNPEAQPARRRMHTESCSAVAR